MTVQKNIVDHLFPLNIFGYFLFKQARKIISIPVYLVILVPESPEACVRCCRQMRGFSCKVNEEF